MLDAWSLLSFSAGCTVLNLFFWRGNQERKNQMDENSSHRAKPVPGVSNRIRRW